MPRLSQTSWQASTKFKYLQMQTLLAYILSIANIRLFYIIRLIMFGLSSSPGY
jgi:hypothetical protein